MRIGVVIVNHNYGSYVGKAVQSVLDQTRRADQIVVVDDGSTDQSLEVIEPFVGQVRLVEQENGGHVAAFQAGFAAIDADVVIFLDADDFLYSSCLELVAASWRRDQTSKVQYRLDTVNRDGEDQGMTFPFFPRGMSAKTVREQAFRHGIYPWTVSSGNAYARSYLEKVLPIDARRFPRSPDGYVNKLAPLYGDVVSLNQALGAYRVHGANSWAQGHGTLNAKTINQTVRLDLALDDEFRRRAKALGAPIRLREDLETPQHLEYRLLGLKLDPEGRAVRSDHVMGLLAKALRGLAVQETLGVRGRIAWGVWFAVLAALPRRSAEKAYIALRSQTGRAGVAKSLIRFTRGLRRPAQPQLASHP